MKKFQKAELTKSRSLNQCNKVSAPQKLCCDRTLRCFSLVRSVLDEVPFDVIYSLSGSLEELCFMFVPFPIYLLKLLDAFVTQ